MALQRSGNRQSQGGDAPKFTGYTLDASEWTGKDGTAMITVRLNSHYSDGKSVAGKFGLTFPADREGAFIDACADVADVDEPAAPVQPAARPITRNSRQNGAAVLS